MAAMDDDLLFMPAARVAARIASGGLSAIEHVSAVLDAAEASQTGLNAFVTIDRAGALAAAREADRMVADGAPLGPLHGVAVSVKDMVAVKGLPNTNGSFTCEHDIPDADAPAIARLRAAGAIIVGKTTTPEFGHKGLTDSLLSGITRNPWNPERTPGGSSGGASAAVAAGLAPLGVGTDGAGSIRGPSATTGIVGLKPTRGFIAHPAKADPFGSQGFVGPMARTVSDTALMADVMAGPDTRDPWSLGRGDAAIMPGLAGNDLCGLSILYAEKMANPEVAPDVVANTRACLDVFEKLGARITPLPDGFDWIEEAGRVLYQSSIHHQVAGLLPAWEGKLTPSFVRFAEWGARFGVADVWDAIAARGDLYNRVQGLFSGHHILVSPTTARTALDADFDATAQVVINGRECGITRQSWTAYQYPFNLTGNPALSVPSGFGEDGLPTGLQLIGPWWSDRALLRLAGVLEAHRPWAHKRPDRTNRGLG
jgi:aspartyl-tRNA(Asn)/glutamyl-tRNA(Gln) amidotransferase subunit A